MYDVPYLHRKVTKYDDRWNEEEPGSATGLEEVEHGLLPHLETLGVHEVAVGAGAVVAHHLNRPRQYGHLVEDQ